MESEAPSVPSSENLSMTANLATPRAEGFPSTLTARRSKTAIRDTPVDAVGASTEGGDGQRTSKQPVSPRLRQVSSPRMPEGEVVG